MKGETFMHYTGTIWRPPFESNSALLQITCGCTHHLCKFCSLYDVDFQMSPMSEIETDLEELSHFHSGATRVFMTGANPMVLSFDKLRNLLIKIKHYLPEVKTIGGFARITDLVPKSIEQLKELHSLGLDSISIGTETGDDDVLLYVNKGNTVAQTIEQCKKLEIAEISYNIVYLTGLAGSGNGEKNAFESAKAYNQIRPSSINIVALTVFPESELYKEIQSGTYIVEEELEKLYELKTFISNLEISTIVFANTISNVAPFTGQLPRDKKKIIEMLQKVINSTDESELQRYRNSIHHL